MKKKIVLILILIAGVCLSFSCRTQLQFTNLIPQDNHFSVGSPTTEALKRYQKAALYSAEREGYALLVIEGDKIVFEEYQNGHTAETPSHIFSGTKSFAGIMAMAAIEDGLIQLDEKVSETLSEFQSDPQKASITVRHLLHFTSGIKQDFFRLSLDGMYPLADQRIKNKYQYALNLASQSKPGERYEYGSSHLMIFGEFMQRKLKENPLKYLERRIFEPLQFRYAGWYTDVEKNPALPYGAWTTAREWAKFGMFLKDDGKFRGKQILAQGRVQECLQGSTVMPAYGLTFWLNKEVPEPYQKDLIPQLKAPAKKGKALYPEGPADLYAAAGHNGNRLYVIPSRNLVIVRLGNNERKYSDQALLALLLEEDTLK